MFYSAGLSFGSWTNPKISFAGVFALVNFHQIFMFLVQLSACLELGPKRNGHSIHRIYWIGYHHRDEYQRSTQQQYNVYSKYNDHVLPTWDGIQAYTFTLFILFLLKSSFNIWESYSASWMLQGRKVKPTVPESGEKYHSHRWVLLPTVSWESSWQSTLRVRTLKKEPNFILWGCEGVRSV